MPRPPETPSPDKVASDPPRRSAEMFFTLLKQRGELWRALRGPLTAEEGVEAMESGQARDLLEALKMRRDTSVELAPDRLKKRLTKQPQKKTDLESIDQQIKQLLSDPTVHAAIHQIRHEKVTAGQKTRQVVQEYGDLKAIEEELSVQDFAILRHKKISVGDRRTLARNDALRQEVSRRLRVLSESPETARATRLAELQSYRDQLIEHRYAMTPSRKELADQIRALWARGEAVILTGSTGTGKTELFYYLTKLLYGRPLARLIRATQNVTPAEIFGKMGLKATPEGGTETVFQPGVYLDAIDHGMPFIIDEFNMLETKIRFGLKELYNRRPGDSVTVQEDSGRPHVIQEGFVIGATANIKGAKHKDRFELDGAESRVFASRQVPFLSKEETYDVLLAGLMNDRSEIRLAREDALETLPRLLEAAELSQQAYEGKQTQFYAEGGGAKRIPASLEKAVIDPGRILKIVAGWPREEARGKNFREYLEDEILHVIRTEDYPEKDRRLLLQIFITKGFFNGMSAKDMGIPGADQTKLKAWGWRDEKKQPPKAETLTPSQVADLDPFGLRRQRASEAADEFLRQPEGVKDLFRALQGVDSSNLPADIREAMTKKDLAPQTILAESKDGTELTFDLKEIREQWDSFYRTHNLPEIADSLPQTITLTPDQTDILKAKAKEGYTRAILAPANIDQHLQKLKQNLTDGYEMDKDGNPIETFLHDYNDKKGVKSSFPNNIETTDPSRLNHPYLLLTNPDEPLLPNSKNKSADELLTGLASLGLTGLSLPDFLIEERYHFEQTNQHLIDYGKNNWTWLLSSRDKASRVLDASWGPGRCEGEVGSHRSGSRSPGLGVRPSVVFPLKP